MTGDGAWLELVRDHLGRTTSGWSSGVFGALAEFERDPGEDCNTLEGALLGWVTPRGALAIDSEMRPLALAYECLSPRPGRWQQGCVFCLPSQSLETGPSVLTDLGCDHDALRPEDREGRLFDMGIGRPGVRFCVRTNDQPLAALLVENSGSSLFDAANPAMAAIKAASPNRVVITPLGRIEVFQVIGSSSSGQGTPEGPHTHVLPKLLANGRSHDANIPVPDGMTPLLSLHPAHPLHSDDGAFDPEGHERFQATLARFGHADYASAKTEAISAMTGDLDPETRVLPKDRNCRAAWRIALRQLTGQGLLDEASRERWNVVLEPRGEERKASEAVPGH